MVTPKITLNAAFNKILFLIKNILFLIKYTALKIILKTEQTTIVSAQQDRWTSYNMIKLHMITTDVLSK